LSLFVRQTAWLNATIKRHKGAAPDQEPTTRRELLAAQRVTPRMPPVEGAPHLLAYLFEVGPALATGGGLAPVDDVALRAWQENTGITLRPWQIGVIRRLSRDYLDELRQAEERARPAPWKQDRSRPFVSQTQAAIRGLKNL
jgi:hypothetical protein